MSSTQDVATTTCEISAAAPPPDVFLPCRDSHGKSSWQEQQVWREGMLVARIVKLGGGQLAVIRNKMGAFIDDPETGERFGVLPLSMFHYIPPPDSSRTITSSGDSKDGSGCGCSKAIGSVVSRVLQDSQDDKVLTYEPIGVVYKTGTIRTGESPDATAQIAMVRFATHLLLPASDEGGEIMSTQTAEDTVNPTAEFRPTPRFMTQWGVRVHAQSPIHAVPMHIWSATSTRPQTTEAVDIEATDALIAATKQLSISGHPTSDTGTIAVDTLHSVVDFAHKQVTPSFSLKCVTLGMVTSSPTVFGHIGITVAHLFDRADGDAAVNRFVYRRLTHFDGTGRKLWVLQPIGHVLAINHKLDSLLIQLYEPVHIPIAPRADGSLQGFEMIVNSPKTNST